MDAEQPASQGALRDGHAAKRQRRTSYFLRRFATHARLARVLKRQHDQSLPCGRLSKCLEVPDFPRDASPWRRRIWRVNALNRYRIGRKLGEGGMGVVYAAHDERLDRSVAIKRIRQGADDQERQRLWREARVAASVSHPNICQLYEIEEDGADLFLTMELLDGEPLSGRLDRGPLSPAEAGQITLAVLSALGALHDQAIVHRDLKPSNIFLSRHGVKLLDFGIARPLPSASGMPGALTQSGLIVGTPRYMAPEQLEGQTVDLRSDLFALGMVLYEMVAGRPPFTGGSIFEVDTAVMKDEPPALGGSSTMLSLDRW